MIVKGRNTDRDMYKSYSFNGRAIKSRNTSCIVDISNTQVYI